jgi:Spy/CpxP family protein refolding chaperone
MNRNLRTLALIFSVVLNVTFIAAHIFQNLSDRPRFAYEELDLSAEQQTQFEAGRHSFTQRLNRFVNGMIQKQAELMDLLAADPVDDAVIQAKLDEIHANHRSMQQIIVQHLLKDREILNPDQRRQFFSVLKDRIRTQGAPGPAWVPPDARRHN